MVLYTYFENRAALIMALIKRQLGRMQVRHTEILHQAETGDVCQVLRESLAFYAQMAQTRPRAYQFIWVQPIDAESPGRQHQHLENHQQHFSRLIQLGIERDSHEELLAQGGFYHNLYMSQFKGQTKGLGNLP